ncbi:exo-beta-N-acetylmuramidase NamZ domain-containing protein, partial [Staphylococcus aureus]
GGLPGGAWKAGITAVIEEADGAKSYWSVLHGPAAPDFHAPAGFAIDLPARGLAGCARRSGLRRGRTPGTCCAMKFGIDRLLADPELRRPLEGKRVALLAHPASVTADLTHSLDALVATGLDISAVFGPQHGVRGDLQDNMM